MSRLDGEVELQTRSLKMDVQFEIPPEYQMISVRSNDGSTNLGSPSRIVAERGDAFVTTKEKGMGIGLAVSRSIIQAHDEQLWAENNPDYVADLSIRLPIATVRSDQYVPQELTISGVQTSPWFGDSSHRRGFIADFCEEFRAVHPENSPSCALPMRLHPGRI